MDLCFQQIFLMKPSQICLKRRTQIRNDFISVLKKCVVVSTLEACRYRERVSKLRLHCLESRVILFRFLQRIDQRLEIKCTPCFLYIHRPISIIFAFFFRTHFFTFSWIERFKKIFFFSTTFSLYIYTSPIKASFFFSDLSTKFRQLSIKKKK